MQRLGFTQSDEEGKGTKCKLSIHFSSFNGNRIETRMTRMELI